MRRPTSFALPSLAAGAAICIALAVAACGSPEPNEELGSGKLRVVAAENFWGSIAQQLGGEKVEVKSIIVNPATDPHSYEPTAGDARTMATAQMAIVNGIGYDEWASKLLSANPSDGRVTLDVGDALGLSPGEDPVHQWYSPAGVHATIAAIVADYDKLRPADASYFSQHQEAFEHDALDRYNALIARISRRYRGVPVGYSESIFQPLGETLGLRLLTPPGFANTIAEGGEVSARDKQTVDRQATNREIKVWVFNSQNATPDVQRVNELARAAHIPVVTVTETLAPVSGTFEQWQVAQLERLQAALHAATGR
jgi:zinc/manganese transport system substrate-binding protein